MGSNSNTLVSKDKLKEDIKSKRFKTKKDLLLNNGFSMATAEHHAGGVKVLNEAIKEVNEEIKQAGVTVEVIVEELAQDKARCIASGDTSSMVRCTELKGKTIGAFIEKSEVSQVEKEENQFLLSRLSRLKSDN